MPIFVDDIDIPIEESPLLSKTYLGSPNIEEPRLGINLGGLLTYGQEDSRPTGGSFDDISKLANVPNRPHDVNAPFQMVSRDELLANKRYPMYERGVDLENMYGLHQNWAKQLGNGILKAGLTAAGTFAQSFATLPNTVEAIQNGSLKSLSGDVDGYESKIDGWLKNIDDVLPNYMTRYEQEHPYQAIIPGFAGSANFWGNSVIKNLGFTVGAIGGALAQDAIIGAVTGGIGEIPLMGAQIGKASLWLNKILTGTNNLDKTLDIARGVGTASEKLLSLGLLSEMAQGIRLTDKLRYGVSLYGASRTEAAIEARDGYNQVKADLIYQTKIDNLGKDASPQQLQEIEDMSINAMNTRFGINMALLTVSNAVQFDNLLKSFTSTAGKGIQGTVTKDLGELGKIRLMEGSLDVFEKQTAKNVAGRVWESVRPKIANIFTEGIYEEGGQYATERGTYDYYTRKYKNLNFPSNKNNWNELNEIVDSTIKGLHDQFNTTEGAMNMIIGGLSAAITGGVLGRIDSIRGTGTDARIQSSINILNNFGITGLLQDKYGETLTSVGIAKDMEEAVRSKNIFKYKNLQHDMFFNFVHSRIPSGMHDVTIEQLSMLKDLSKKEFEEMFGIDFTNSNKSTVSQYVEELINNANDIKSTTESLDKTFINPFKFSINPKGEEQEIETNNYNTFNSWKADIAYYSSLSSDRNERLDSIEQRAFKINPLLNNDVLSSLTNKESLRELSSVYEEEANQLNSTITEFTSPEDKRKIKNQIKSLRTLSAKISLFTNNKNYELQDFHSILNFELNGREIKDDVVPIEKAQEIFEYGDDINHIKEQKKEVKGIIDSLITKEGFEKYFEQAENIANNIIPEKEIIASEEDVISLYEFKNKGGEIESLEEGREYQIPGIKKSIIKKLSEDRWQITSPDGKVSFASTKEKAQEDAKEIDGGNNELLKVRIRAFNPDGTIMVEDMSGNIQNISPDRLNGYEKIITAAEKLAKYKETLDKEQDELENSSGNTGTGDSNNLDGYSESALKPTPILFTSTTTESEGSDDVNWQKNAALSAPHIRNSREFLNKVKTFKNRGNMRTILVTPTQEESIGLKGLTQLSYGATDELAATAEFQKDVRSIETGFVAAVFVVQEGKNLFFIDKDGKKGEKVGKQIELENIVFQTMPTILLENSIGKPKYRSGEKEEATAYSKAWGEYRKTLFSLSSDKLFPMEFTISRGIPDEEVIEQYNDEGDIIKGKGKKVRNHIEGTLLDIDKKGENAKIIKTQQGLIVVSNGSITHNEETINFPKGVPLFHFHDTLDYINNRTFTDKQAESIYAVIKALAAEAVAQSEAGGTVSLNKQYSKFLQNVLYWKRKTDVTTNNQIKIDGSTLQLGEAKWELTDIADKRGEIITQLKSAYHNINNDSVTRDFSHPFTEYYIDDDKVIQIRTWDNYQSYLLLNEFPDGTSRNSEETPLTTSVRKPTESIPYTHKQKYAVLGGIELPIQLEKKEEIKKTPTVTPLVINGWTIDNETENTFSTTKNGDVKFTANKEGDEFNVTIIPNDVTNKTIESILNSPAIMETINKAISEEISPKDKIVMWLGNFIKFQIIKTNQSKPEIKTKIPPIVKKEESKSAYKKWDDFNVDKGTEIFIKEQSEFFSLGKIEAFKVNKDLEHLDAVKIGDKWYNNHSWWDFFTKEDNKEKPYNPDNTEDDAPFNRAGKGEEGEILTEEERQLFKEYVEKNAPNIPFEVLENVITISPTEKAWGVFEDGVTKFYKGAPRGVKYHELFEGIWKGFLSTDDQQSILNEFKNRRGLFIDRESGKEIHFINATDNQAKERIADDFGEYRIGKLPARTLGERILRFFKNIIEFFKSFVQHPSLKKELFKAIDTGRFKNYVLPENIKTFSPEYSKIPGLREKQVIDFVDDMVARTAGILYSEAKKALIFSSNGITSKEIFDTIEEQYISLNRRQQLTDKAWEMLVIRTKEMLRPLGVSFNLDGGIDINNVEKNNKDYAPETFSIDTKKTSSMAIKFSLFTLFRTITANQEKSLSFTLPAKEPSSIKGYKLLNFSRTFATLLDKISNTGSVSKLTEKLKNLAERDSNYVRLFQRAGGSLETKTFSFDDFNADDWRYFIQFSQTFTKQKPLALIQYTKGNETFTRPADLYGIAEQTKRKWVENIKTLATDKNSLITLDKSTKTYNVADLSAIPIRRIDQKISFLLSLGIDFPIDVYNRLKSEEKIKGKSQKDEFNDAVAAIQTYASGKSISSMRGDILSVNSQLTTLARLLVEVTNPAQESTLLNTEGERVQKYTDGNYPSLFENIFNESETLEDLLQWENMPQLKDIFSKHSQILKKGGLFFNKEGVRIKDIKVQYIDGIRDENTGKQKATKALSLSQRKVLEINQNLNGNYYVLIPADATIQWQMNLGNSISFPIIEGKDAWNEIYSVFRGYLSDEISLALDYKNREQLKNVKRKAKELRFFKDILFEKELKGINELIKKESTQIEIEEYIINNIDKINEAIRIYIEDINSKTKTSLINTKQIFVNENDYSFPGIDTGFIQHKDVGLDKDHLSEKALDDIIMFANVNFIINNIELHKTLFGDPLQFATKEASAKQFKYIKSFLSPRRPTFDSPEANNFFNSINNVNGIELKRKDPGFHEFLPYTNTITIKDDVVVGVLANIIKDYGGAKEADSFSWLMDGTFREIRLKNGTWDLDGPEEQFHQWHMAYTRQRMPGWNYSEEQIKQGLKEHDEKLIASPIPQFKLSVIKPIVSGNKYNKNRIELVVDKFAQMPIYYHMAEEYNLGKFYIQMLNEEKGYAIVESGRKIGAEDTHSLYNNDGSFNNEPFNNNIQVSWKAYGIQQEMESKDDGKQTMISQLTNMSSMDYYENGEPISEEIHKEVGHNIEILGKMQENAYNEFLSDLGVEDNEQGYFMQNGKALSDILMYEMLKRTMSQNAKDAIKLNEHLQFNAPFEASSSYVQIQDIIFSMIDKRLIRPTLHGGAHVQVPVTMFEKATRNRKLSLKETIDKKDVWKNISNEEYSILSTEHKENVFLTDSTLGFYVDEKGKRHIQIMIGRPNYLSSKKFPNTKEGDEALLIYLNSTEEGQSILRGVGARIPTQAMSSIDVFEIAKFLPAYMGNTVVMPSMGVVKTNADFDIDKLNMYLKATYIDVNDDIRLVKYQGTEESTKQYFDNMYEQRIYKKIAKIEDFDEFRGKMWDVFRKLESLEELNSENLDVLSDEESEFYILHKDVLQEIVNQAYEKEISPSEYLEAQIEELGIKKEELTAKLLNEQLKTKYVKDMYKKSLENEYYSSLDRLLTFPENYKNLITPVDDGGLKDEANALDILRGEDKLPSVKNPILDRNITTALRHAFVLSKQWVGIAATSITSLAIRQKSRVYINTNKISSLSIQDRKFLGEGNIVLPHNILLINGIEYASLSGKYTHDGKQLLSNRLSGYGTAIVDAVNDPFITKIIQSNLVVGPALFMESLGMGENVPIFLAQPIISEYLNIVENNGTTHLFKQANINEAKSKFVTTGNEKTKEINIDELKDNIHDYYDNRNQLSEEKNAEQFLILDEFLKYAKMANYNFKFTQATNYNTGRFRSMESFLRKEWATNSIDDKNIISDAGEVLQNTSTGKQKEIIKKAIQATGAIFKLNASPFSDILADKLQPYGEREFMSSDKFDKITLKAKTALLDYIIQTKTDIHERIEELLIGERGVANRLIEAQQRFPDIEILSHLQVASGDKIGGARSVKLEIVANGTSDMDIYVDEMRELRDYNNEFTTKLYNDLITVSILQGTYSSPISIKNIIPEEDFSKIVEPTISSLASTKDLEAFSEGMFEQNNWKDEDVVPRIDDIYFREIKPWEKGYKEPSAQLTSFGDIYSLIYKYHSPLFVDIPILDIQKIDRRILILNEKWNSQTLQSNVITVPRVVTQRDGTQVDMMTGNTVTPMTWAKKKAKNDDSLSAIFGYKKVLLPNGSPLLVLDGNNEISHVYKMANLYGDGMYSTENYTDFRPSVFDNGTVKIENEIPSIEIIKAYNGGIIRNSEEISVSLQEKQILETSKVVVNKSLSWGEIKNLPVYSEKGINVMRKQNTNEHFGNPFTANPELAKGNSPLILVKDISTAVQAYKDWIKDNYILTENVNGVVKEYQDINIEQREWINSQIEEGKLDGKTLLYMNDKGEYYSHADALRDIVNNKNIEQPIPIEKNLPNVDNNTDLTTDDFKC